MRLRRGAVQTGVHAPLRLPAREGEDSEGVTCSKAAGLDHYVEASDRTERSKHAWIRRRSRSFMNNAG